ncbi:MAG: TonB-dependent receptor [Pseudomonadales bacterium]|nr:TonB-dependent receptor [Pseudomonadales bacterium]
MEIRIWQLFGHKTRIQGSAMVISINQIGISTLVPIFLLATFGSSQTFAESEYKRQSVIEEIVVTAQKREENLQDVSIAATAFSGESLKNVGFQEGLTITQQVPNMNFFAIFGEASSPSISLRGISLVNFSDSWEAPVSLYVDDVYRGKPSDSAIQLFDVSRVEVLRGPQGTLFGRNNTDGLVHHITNNPGDEFDANVSVQAGTYNQRIVEGMVDLL